MKDLCLSIVDANNTKDFGFLADSADREMCERFKEWQKYIFENFLKRARAEAFQQLGYQNTREGRKATRKSMNMIFGVETIDSFEGLDAKDVFKRFLSARYWALPYDFFKVEYVASWCEGDSGYCVIKHERPASHQIDYTAPKLDAMMFRKIDDQWVSLMNAGLSIENSHPIFPGELSNSSYAYG